MRTVVSRQSSIISSRRWMFVCLLLTAFGTLSCSIPNLESTECSQARDNIKQFYSWYLGTDADIRSKHPEIHDKYISSAFTSAAADWEVDHYVLTNNFPKSFRVGSCKAPDAQHVEFQVLLLWRDDTNTIQKEVKVMAERQNDSWKITHIGN